MKDDEWNMIVVINKSGLCGLTDVIKNKIPVKMQRKDRRRLTAFATTNLLVEAGADPKAFSLLPPETRWMFHGNETTFVATREEYERWLGDE